MHDDERLLLASGPRRLLEHARVLAAPILSITQRREEGRVLEVHAKEELEDKAEHTYRNDIP